jgi:hypothetical protein
MYERCKQWLDAHVLTEAVVERLPGKDRETWKVGRGREGGREGVREGGREVGREEGGGTESEGGG